MCNHVHYDLYLKYFHRSPNKLVPVVIYLIPRACSLTFNQHIHVSLSVLRRSWEQTEHATMLDRNSAPHAFICWSISAVVNSAPHVFICWSISAAVSHLFRVYGVRSFLWKCLGTDLSTICSKEPVNCFDSL